MKEGKEAQKAESIAGVENWQTITPNIHYDWINQRSKAFQDLYPVGSKDVKAGKSTKAIFKLFSGGYKTGKDAYMYNFSRDACLENASKMVDDYLSALKERKQSNGNIDRIVRRNSAHIRWDGKVRDSLKQEKPASFSSEYIRKVTYRPFVTAYCYADDTFAQRPGQIRSIFPGGAHENRAICMSGVGSKLFSALVVGKIPDVGFVSANQCFSRYRYQQTSRTRQSDLQGVEAGLQRVDNITDTALRDFRARYGDDSITKDDIFDYVYGVLHAPDYGWRFANDLAKELPRIPLAENFRDFIEAGCKLASLHLGYETCEEVPLEIVPICDRDPLEIEPIPDGKLKSEDFRIGAKKMGFTDTKYDTLRINDHIGLRRIPAAAQAYKVNGRTPLEWLIDRYRVTQDKESGIVNDPNDWFDDPRDIVSAVGRLAYVSKESAGIIARLPDLVADELRDVPYEPSHAELCRRDSIIIATSPQEPEDQAFIDAVTDWSE